MNLKIIGTALFARINSKMENCMSHVSSAQFLSKTKSVKVSNSAWIAQSKLVSSNVKSSPNASKLTVNFSANQTIKSSVPL